MRISQLAIRRTGAGVAAVVVAGAAALVVAAATDASAQEGPTDLYIVQFAADPVASYEGGVAGIPATKPGRGQKVKTNSPNAQAYRQHLERSHRDARRAAGVAEEQVVRELTVAFNGFTAALTKAEVAELERSKDVVKVWPNEIFEIDTAHTPNFLGLTGDGGVWQEQFGGAESAGEGTIVGVLDTGFTPENPSFAPLPEPRPDQAIIDAKWAGECVAGTEEPVACNNKVLGARFYNASGLQQPIEYNSPRDFNGHGSHTASTAAGNGGVAASAFGTDLGTISGIAPAARLSVYKVLWHNPATGGASGGSVDLVAAINDAVADGVDVINYSISGNTAFIVDSVSIAFLFAADAGVFVSASAGNSGPTASTVNHNGPWVTTVAAGTHSPKYTTVATLGNGESYAGVGIGAAVPSTGLIDSAAAGLPGAPANAVRLCFSDADNNPTNGVVPVLDPAKVAGKIVICQRGGNARVDKSFAVSEAGGAGMIQYNTSPAESFNADVHWVPSVHVGPTEGAAIQAYATGTTDPTASLSEYEPLPAQAPVLAGFSSTGPAVAGGGDLLKPDIMAPGVDVVAAYSPATRGLDFEVISGTSMAAPHIAGLAALIMSANPTWSPMWVKSAMMTTATPNDNTGGPIQRVGNATPFDYGSGQVVPAPAFSPGLVYDSDIEDWFQYACSINQLQLLGGGAAVCASLPSIDPSDFNGPSIAVGALAGTQTITRTVTNTDPDDAGVYRPVVSMPGFDVTVSPRQLTVPPGQSRTFRVTITRTTAPLGQYAFGRLTWVPVPDRGTAVSSPLVVRPVPFAAPAEATFTGTSGELTVNVGYTGTLNSSVQGLTAGTVTPFDLDTAGPDFSSAAPAAGPQVGLFTVDIPAGTALARFQTFDADFPGVTDVDLWVYRQTGPGTRVQVGFSAGATAQETVTLNNPQAGTYEVYVDLFAVGGDGTATVPLNSWVVPNTSAGNLTVDPASTSVTSGPLTLALTTSGLTAGVRYLGTVVFDDGTSTLGRTVVRFDA